jgi:antitoxin MazE
MMITQLKKWGNSLAIRLPQNLLSQVNIQENEDIEIRVEDNTIILSAVSKHKYQLDELLAQITPENKQELIDFGKPIGKEIW